MICQLLTQDIHVQRVCPGDEFVIIACDGLWDVLSSQQAVNFVRRRLRSHRNVQQAAEELIQKAIAMNSIDNVSAVVVGFDRPSAGVR